MQKYMPLVKQNVMKFEVFILEWGVGVAKVANN